MIILGLMINTIKRKKTITLWNLVETKCRHTRNKLYYELKQKIFETTRLETEHCYCEAMADGRGFSVPQKPLASNESQFKQTFCCGYQENNVQSSHSNNGLSQNKALWKHSHTRCVAIDTVLVCVFKEWTWVLRQNVSNGLFWKNVLYVNLWSALQTVM